MAVRHRIHEQGSAVARPAPAPPWRLLSFLLGVVAVVALLVATLLFVGEMTVSALTAAAVCIAAGWGRNRLAARAARHHE